MHACIKRFASLKQTINSNKEKLNRKLIKNLRYRYQFVNKKHLINKAVEFVRVLIYLFSFFFARLNCMSVLHLQIFLFFLHAYIYKINVLILPFIRLWPKYGRNVVFRRCFLSSKVLRNPLILVLLINCHIFFFITTSIGILNNVWRQIFVDIFVPNGSYQCWFLYIRLVHWVTLQMQQ